MKTKEERKWRILFLDDDESFLEGIRLMLREFRHSWNMEFVTSVKEARTRVRDREYDVIVSDVTMGELSGLDFLASLSTSDPEEQLPIIMLTGNAEQDLKRRALDLGAADLLSKPISREDLVARIRSVGRLNDYQRRLRQHAGILHNEVKVRTRELEKSQQDIIFRLAKAGEFRDEETGCHVNRVAYTSRILCESLGLNSTLTEQVFLTSPLHDLGKIGVPDSILLKPGKLTHNERVIMQSHCVIGAQILADDDTTPFKDSGNSGDRLQAPVDPLRHRAFEIALSHHERWDGTGYPNQLREDEIPISGRIVALCDVYDALRSERPYKQALSVEKTRSIILDGRGSHFAPEVCDAFETVLDKFEKVRARFVEPSLHKELVDA